MVRPAAHRRGCHVAPNMVWAWENVLQALYPDKFQKDPKRNKDGTWTTADGSIVDKDTASTIEKAGKKAIRAGAQSYYRNVNDFVDEVFTASIEDTDYRDINLKTVCTQPPPGQEVRMSDFADTSI